MTMWKDMTDEEKGAILLAHHEGKAVQFRGARLGAWFSVGVKGEWYDAHEYRIKPAEPVYRTTSQDVWCHAGHLKYPELQLRNYGLHNTDAYYGRLTQKYKDDVLVEFTWKVDDA